MAIDFRYPDKERQMKNMHVLEERTFVTQDLKKVVDVEKHKGGSILLGPKGHSIPMSQAIELGLVEGEKEEVEEKTSKEKKEKK